jgi:hypothetical protein
VNLQLDGMRLLLWGEKCHRVPATPTPDARLDLVPGQDVVRMGIEMGEPPIQLDFLRLG